jgi:predicted dehydrogenase
MAKPLRIGIVGAGFAAHFHLASYRKVYGEDFEIAGLYGPTSARVHDLMCRFGIARAYECIGDLFADPSVDVVDLCAPNHLHVPLILQAAESGKHIICEKPLGGYFGPRAADQSWTAAGASRRDMLEAAVAQSKSIKAAVARAGVTFCYGENWVYAPPIAKVNRLMSASGSTILRIQAEESHSGSHAKYAKQWRTAGGGSLLRLGVHPIGAAMYLKYQEGRRRTGKPIRVRSVLAQVASLTAIESFLQQPRHHLVTDWEDVEDWGTVTMTFEDGSVGQVTSTDTALGGIRNYLTANGSQAVATANINPNNTCTAYTPDGQYFGSEYLVEKIETKGGWTFPAADEDAVTGYVEELRDFIGSIANKRPPQSDLLLAIDVLTVVYASYLSAEQGSRVDLKHYLA